MVHIRVFYLFVWALTVNFGFLLRGFSPCTERKSFVRTNFENNVKPVPPPGIGNENFIFVEIFVWFFIFI